ncbi:MAG: hypothetical protein ACK5LL_09880 [Suipraeoptans sp.]
MNKRKIGKSLLFIIGLVLIYWGAKTYAVKDIWENVVEFNLEMSQKKWYWLFLVYWIEILFILMICDLILYMFSVWMSVRLDNIARSLLKKEQIRLSIFLIRLNYAIEKWSFYLQPSWWGVGGSYHRKVVWNSINRSTVKDIVLGVFFSLIRLPGWITLFITALSLKWIKLDDLQSSWQDFVTQKFDFWERIKLLSPLTIVILIVFIGYFVSFKGSIRRTIAQTNRKKMEDVIQEHRELVEVIGDSIYLIAPNLEYVIKCQELVADLWISAKFPEYRDKTMMWNGELNVENFCFVEIPELETISQRFDKLYSNGNSGAARAFSGYRYEILTLMGEGIFLDSGKLNEKFFTKKGMEKMCSKKETYRREYSKEEIKEKRDNYLEFIPYSILDGLKLLYKFCRYYDEMNKLLNFKSDKVGRALRMFTGKE